MHKIQLYNHTRHPSNLLERFSPSLSVHLIAIVVFNCVCVCVNKKKQVSSDTDSLVYPFPAFSLSQCTHYLSTKMLQFRLFGSVVSGAYLPVPSHRDLHTSSSSIDMCVHKTGSAALRPFFDRLYPSASLLTTQVSLKSSVILSNTTVCSVDHYILPSVFA